MDPNKYFVCEKGHIVNDLQRVWGKLSPCPQCEEENFWKVWKELNKIKEEEK